MARNFADPMGLPRERVVLFLTAPEKNQIELRLMELRRRVADTENLVSDPASQLPTNQKDKLSIPTIEVTEK